MALALLFFFSGAASQSFLPGEDGSVISLGSPSSLSSPCAASLNQTVKCNATLASVAFDGLFPSTDLLPFICTSDCYQSLQTSRSSSTQSCSSDVYVTGGEVFPATFNVDTLLYTYSFTCLKDASSSEFCAPQVDAWLQTGPTNQQLCSDCMLKTYQAELNSSLGYDADFATYYSSLTASCQATKYPVTSQPPYTASAPTTITTTTTAPAPAITCASNYTVQAGDDCNSVSLAKGVSTALLQYQNLIAADCSNFPEPGQSLCLPASCDIYTVQANETCNGIVEAHGYDFTVQQMISWNPDINRDCSNLDQLQGAQICLSLPGDNGSPVASPTSNPTYITSPVPVPSNVVAGTNVRCAKYYEVAPGDTCGSITIMLGISLTDFYFLNPEVNQTDCTNLYLGYSYCVQPVGDIQTYSGYGASRNPCFASTGVVSSCIATTAAPTDTYWEFPTQSTTMTSNITQPTQLPLASGTPNNCAKYDQYYEPIRNGSSANTCDYVASFYDITVEQLVAWNPSLSYDPDDQSACHFVQGYRYCVLQQGVTPMPTTTPTPTATSQATSTGTNGLATPLPTQTGMTASCDKFYFVQSGDGCYDIASDQSISLDDLYKWNPALNGDCTGLYPSYYLCVGVTDGSSTKPPTPTTTGGGIVTPTPTQAGMVAGCGSFYEVQSNDGCYDIADSHHIALDDFYDWNPAVKSDCSGLYPSYYVCVGLVSSSSTTPTSTTPTPTTSSTTSTGGVATPTPTQSGMASGCTKFYKAKSGDGCYDIAQSAGISLDQFYSWNAALNGDCSGLYPDYYYCIARS